MTALLERIVDNGLCQGCGGCVAAVGNSALAMEIDDNGFARPKRLLGPAIGEDDLVAAVCSGLSLKHLEKSRSYDAVWGPLVTVQTGYATDPEVRHQGSSGGVITALAIHLLRSGEVDFVVQTRANQHDPVGNVTEVSRDRLDAISAAGSRYAPSSPLVNLEAYLGTGQKFAFVGRPCDVAALRRIAHLDPRVDAQVPIMVAFFCAGVPSRKGALKVLDALGVVHSDVKAFAYRGRGWPGLTRAVRYNGSEETMDYNSSWGTILNRHLQFRCKICPDGTGEFADVVCADAWYGKDGYPDFAEAEGRSLVVARTERGRRLLDVVEGEGDIRLSDLDVSEIRSMQPYQYDRKRAVLARVGAMLLRLRPIPRFKGLDLWSLVFRSNPIWLVRNLIGTYRRIPKGRIV